MADSDGAEGAAEAPLGSSATLEDPPTTHVPREEEAAVSVKFDRPITPADEPPIPEEPSECAADAPDEPDAVRPAEASSKPDRALAADAGGATKTGSVQEKQTLDLVVGFKYGTMVRDASPPPHHPPRERTHRTSLRSAPARAQKGEYTMRTNIFPADFLERKHEASMALKIVSFLGDAGEQIARANGIDDQGGSAFWGDVQTEIVSVTNPSFEGTDPSVCMRVECGGERLKVTLTLNDYVAYHHDTILEKAVAAIAEQKGWVPEDVQVVEVFQVNADGSKYGSPPKKRGLGIGTILNRTISRMTSGLMLSPGPDHRVAVSPESAAQDATGSTASASPAGS